MKIAGTHIIFLALLLLLGSRCPVHAISVAVLPVDDLSSAYNSESQAMTEFLRHEVGKRGLTVVRKEAVTGFMSARRIRQLGILQTQDVIAARPDMQADFVLLGALCQQNETSAAIGMTISLLRTSDGKTIWTSSKGVSLVDEQRFMGIKAPATMADLLPILASSLFTSWPDELNFSSGPAMAKNQSQGVAKQHATLEVDSVFFSPKYVRPGQEVNCTIRFKGKNDRDMSKVFVKVGNRIHSASSEDGLYYQVAWVGSDDKKGGQPLQVAMNATDPSVVSGVWSGDQRDADYPVSLILEGPSGTRHESYLGSYVVDSLAPAVSFKMQGKRINEILSFRTELPIAVLFKRSEPISQWEFAVTAQDGEVLLQEKGSDQPPANFVWRGQNSRNLRADAGLYEISLKVWDRAQNMGVVTEKVQLLAANPGLNLAVAGKEERIQATLTALDGVPITSWRMELWSADSAMLKTYVGESLPVRITLPRFADTVDKDKIECVLQVRDSLGMKATRKIPNLLAQVVLEDQTAPAANSTGKIKDDSDLWQADF